MTGAADASSAAPDGRRACAADVDSRAATAAAARWTVAVDGAQTVALFEPAAAHGCSAVFVCAHGAGGHSRDRGMERLAQVLRERGVSLVRFNFLYRERGLSRPDPMPSLKACMAAVIERARLELGPRPLIIGGRSMGGRAASMLAADGIACDGLLLFAYPLHPAGKPERLRDARLPQIRVPVLCVNGTRDPLCGRNLMDGVVARLGPRWNMHWVDGADHSFHVLRSAGRTDDQVLAGIGDASARWLQGMPG